MSAPNNHVVDAMSIESDGYVSLFKVQLVPSGFIAFTNSQQVTWQSIEYDGVPCQISGIGSYASEQTSRPRMDVANPDGAYSILVAQGALEGAQLTRYRVLRDDLINDRNVFVKQSWKIVRIATLTKQRLSLELRELGDGPNFVVPAQTFSPPKFPVVSVR
jgi:phage-related protein